jgi:hypothetical protein
MTDKQLSNIFFQLGHFLGGYAAVVTLALFHVHHWLLVSIVGVTGWAAFKEFYIDKKYEDPTMRGSDLEDFIFYIVGLAAGIGVAFLSGAR